jgi:hypothetical protein
MTLTQQTFLGASIRGFNASIGWNNQASTCTVDLVEDPTNGDNFNPPSIGTAVVFDYEGWQFGGLLQSYEKQYGQQGNPVYTVEIRDPRELLAGVQLILQDYTGSTMGLPNIYNIYGYLESYPDPVTGFGSSQANEAGIPWYLIRNAFYQLQFSLKPIYFQGSYYIFDPFIGLDVLPYYYRIGGDSISALEFVENICEAISADFFVEMIPLENDDTPATSAIKLRLVNRNYALANNTINRFVNQTEGAVAKQAGYELANEVTTRFVVGGKVNNMWFQNNTTQGTPSPYEDSIIPYWGEDAYGNVIVGQGNFYGPTGAEYQFTLDGRPLALMTGKPALIFYRTDLAEMVAARAGQDSWEAFLWFHDGNNRSVHYGKARMLQITDGKLSDELWNALNDFKGGGDIPKLQAMRNIDTSNQIILQGNHAEDARRKAIANVYQYIKKFATDYYGKKFMVTVPFVVGAWVPETTTIRLSMKPVQTGYVPEEYWGNAIYYGYMPYNPERFTDQQNKLYPYAAFAGMSQTGICRYALDRLSQESYILDQYPNQSLGVMRENLFVKASVDENLVFLNKQTLFSPRAVITLDGPIADNIDKTRLAFGGLLQELKYWLLDGGSVSETQADDFLSTFGDWAGNDFAWKPKDASFYIPNMCAIPLESQVLRYGPWYYSNRAGRVEFENDSSLVPWNFGSFTAMNNAGNAKVTSAITSQVIHEKGSVEYPGVPALSLGRALLNGGPTVTDVNVSVGENGVTTSYRMNTWSWQFGRLGKYNVERFTRLSKLGMQMRKSFREFYGYAQPINIAAAGGKDGGDHKDVEPSMLMLSGEMANNGKTGDEKIVKPNVAALTGKRLTKTISNQNYASKAGISMDGLFVPYSTKTSDGGTDMPHFETPTGSEPTIDDYNPFGSDSIATVFPEGDMPITLAQDDVPEVKSIAFRAPMILAGWGYDTEGNRVPEGDNYKTRADQWKVGPLDVRWDDTRKVWSAGPGGSGGGVIIGRTTSNIVYGGAGSVVVYAFDPDKIDTPGVKPFQATSLYVEAYEFVLPQGEVIYSNSYVAMTIVGGVYVIIHVICPCGR